MKTNIIILWLLLLSPLIFLPHLTLQNNQNHIDNFTLGFRETQILTYKITYYDENLASEYLGSTAITYYLGRDAYVGAYRFFRIENIRFVNNLTSLNNSLDCNGWLFNLSKWDWLTSNDWDEREGEPDIVFENSKIFENPIDLGDNIYDIKDMTSSEKYVLDSLHFLYAVPLPVNEYLSKIQWADDWIIKDKTISIKYNESMGKLVEKIHVFSNSGFLLKTKLLTENGRRIYEYILENKYISILVLLVFLLIASFFIFGLGYLILKKSQLKAVETKSKMPKKSLSIT